MDDPEVNDGHKNMGSMLHGTIKYLQSLRKLGAIKYCDKGMSFPQEFLLCCFISITVIKFNVTIVLISLTPQ